MKKLLPIFLLFSFVSAQDTTSLIMQSMDYSYGKVYDGIGYDKAVLVLRFDDGYQQCYDSVYTQLKSRNLPGTFGIVANHMLTGGTTYLDSAEVLTMAINGMQIMCHSYSHGNSPTSFSQFRYETIGADSILRAKCGIYTDNFAQPGSWTGDFSFNSPIKVNNVYGRFLSENFPVWNGGNSVDRRISLPMQVKYGLPYHAGEGYTSAQLIVELNAIIKFGYCEVINFHPNNFDQPGKITSADFRNFLDTIVDRQSKGLTVLTLNGAVYAKRQTPANFVYNGDFELSTMGWTLTGAPTIEDSGRAGNCILTSTTNYISQYFPQESMRSLRFTAYAKTVSGTDTARVLVRDGLNVNYVYKDFPITCNWTKCEFIFSPVPRTLVANLHIWYILLQKANNNNGKGANVLWDDIKLEKN